MLRRLVGLRPARCEISDSFRDFHSHHARGSLVSTARKHLSEMGGVFKWTRKQSGKDEELESETPEIHRFQLRLSTDTDYPRASVLRGGQNENKVYKDCGRIVVNVIDSRLLNRPADRLFKIFGQNFPIPTFEFAGRFIMDATVEQFD